jgi:hypothetical protein
MFTKESIEEANKALGTVDISKGNKKTAYVMVNERVKAFRAICPGGCISTEIISLEDGVVTMRAVITDENKNVIATGMAQEKETSSFINKTSFIENCETSAVGRALGFAGIGIDGSMASAEEVANAIVQQDQQKTENVMAQKIDSIKVESLKKKCAADGVKIEKLCEAFRVNDLDDLTEKQFANAINGWEKVKKRCS